MLENFFADEGKCENTGDGECEQPGNFKENLKKINNYSQNKIKSLNICWVIGNFHPPAIFTLSSLPDLLLRPE